MNPNTANAITVCRIVLSILLFLCPVYSVPFWIVYVSAGATDVLDGFIARKMGITSTLGSRLDTAADFVFFVVCLIIFIPVLDIPVWLWIWFFAIVAIKIVNVYFGYRMYGKFVPSHTVLNKIAGALVFIFPFSLLWMDLVYSASFVSAVATLAAAQEGHYIRTGVLS